jgi:hypothetical protein
VRQSDGWLLRRCATESTVSTATRAPSSGPAPTHATRSLPDAVCRTSNLGKVSKASAWATGHSAILDRPSYILYSLNEARICSRGLRKLYSPRDRTVLSEPCLQSVQLPRLDIDQSTRYASHLSFRKAQKTAVSIHHLCCLVVRRNMEQDRKRSGAECQGGAVCWEEVLHRMTDSHAQHPVSCVEEQSLFRWSNSQQPHLWVLQQGQDVCVVHQCERG